MRTIYSAYVYNNSDPDPIAKIVLGKAYYTIHLILERGENLGRGRTAESFLRAQKIDTPEDPSERQVLYAFANASETISAIAASPEENWPAIRALLACAVIMSGPRFLFVGDQ